MYASSPADAAVPRLRLAPPLVSTCELRSEGCGAWGCWWCAVRRGAAKAGGCRSVGPPAEHCASLRWRGSRCSRTVRVAVSLSVYRTGERSLGVVSSCAHALNLVAAPAALTTA
eukprot:898970-Pyramimonas_sp.AAC.1